MSPQCGLFFPAELFPLPEALLPWGRMQPAPLRCHSHRPWPPDRGPGHALLETRHKAVTAAGTRLCRNRKPQTEHNRAEPALFHSRAMIISDCSCSRFLAEMNMFRTPSHRTFPPFSIIENTQFWQPRTGAAQCCEKPTAAAS